MSKGTASVAFLVASIVVIAVVSYQSGHNPQRPSGLDFMKRETAEEFLTRRQTPACANFDCFGVCGGKATKDCHGVCNGTAVKDCAGVCGGSAKPDCKGVCNGPSREDCKGECGGKASVDCHGRCGGPSVQSCDGVCMSPCTDLDFGLPEFRAHDGSGNNQLRTQMGQARRPTFHFANFHYDDGVSVPRGGLPSRLPGPRTISNAIFNRAEPTSPVNTTLVIVGWGQFVDHDITATPTVSPCDDSMRIPVPTGDPRFDPQSRGGVTMQFCRSLSGMTPREQRTDVTTWLDASTIYGSDDTTAAALRTNQGGKLITGTDNLLPLNTLIGVSMANTGENVVGDNVFAAGDSRANENPMLLIMQTLFMREHNRFVDSHIACLGGDPAQEDELRYQLGRKWVASLIQHITYDEFLPAVLGQPLEPYVAYDPQADVTMAIEFNTAAYRLGHSAAPSVIPMLDNDLNPIRNGTLAAAPLRLSNAYFNPTIIQEFDIMFMLNGISRTPMHHLDAIIVEDMRDRLFRSLDLVAINIQRGRDHGMASYNDMRVAYGLERCADYDCISADPTTVAAFQEAYGPGNIDDVDAYPGGLAEDHVPGSILGPLFHTVVKEQFTRIRNADRFWYENNQWSESELQMIKNTKLSDVIRRNTGGNVPDDVFHVSPK